MSRFVTPFTVGFSVALIPCAWIFFASYQSPEQRMRELQKSGYAPSAQLPKANTATNQQLLAAIFNQRHEPDLYTALGEVNRRPAAAAAGGAGSEAAAAAKAAAADPTLPGPQQSSLSSTSISPAPTAAAPTSSPSQSSPPR